MAALKKKDDDMRAMEERYKMYLEKARNVITFKFIAIKYCRTALNESNLVDIGVSNYA